MFYPAQKCAGASLLLTSASQGALTILFIILHSKENSFMKEIFLNWEFPPEGKCHKIYSIHHDVDFINV